jgi:asparagine synthetase B (glutamine-hydrolysing)
MPGILGIIRPQSFQPEIAATLDRMAEPLRYAPDQTVQHFQRGRFAGSVVDYGPRFGFLKSAAAERDGVLLLMDGEVFPDASEVPHELQGDSPTVQRAEYCLHLYLERGPQFVRSLNGTFTIAVYDRRDHTIHLYNDRFGSAPLFIWTGDRQCVFASSQRSLLCYRDHIGRQYDRDAIAELVVFERVLGEKTLFTDIRRLVPASHAIWNAEGLRIEKYWCISCEEDVGTMKNWRDAAVEVNRRLDRSLRKRQADGAKAAALVSGGIDSRLLLHFCSRETLALTFSNRNFPLSIETRLAARAAHVLGKEHVIVDRESDHYAMVAELAVDVIESQMVFASSHSLGLHQQMLQTGIQIVLTGNWFDTFFKGMYSAGDVVENGYPDEPRLLRRRRLARRLADSQIVRRLRHLDLMMLALTDDMKERAAVAKERAIQTLIMLGADADNLEACAEGFTVLDLQACPPIAFARGLRTCFPDRSPTYDNDLQLLAMSIPVQWKTDGRIVRRALQLANPRVAHIIDANTGLPAGLCPPWNRVFGAIRQSMRNTAKQLARYSRCIASLRPPAAGCTIFCQNSSWHDRDGLLKLSERYRSMVENAVEGLDETIFDKDIMRELLRDDFNASAPRLAKLWEAILTFQLFDNKWGPATKRPESPYHQQAVML